MKLLTLPNVLAVLGFLDGLAHLIQGTTSPNTVAHKVADKLLAILPNAFDLLGVGPDGKPKS